MLIMKTIFVPLVIKVVSLVKVKDLVDCVMKVTILCLMMILNV